VYYLYQYGITVYLISVGLGDLVEDALDELALIKFCWVTKVKGKLFYKNGYNKFTAITKNILPRVQIKGSKYQSPLKRPRHYEVQTGNTMIFKSVTTYCWF